MSNIAKVEIGMRGPVDGMGTADLRGDYFMVTLTFPDDELVRGRISIGQVEELRDLCNHFLSTNN